MRELFSVKRARPSPEGGAHASHMAGASLPATPLSQPAVAAGSTAGTVGDDCQLCVADGCPSSSADGQLDEASPRRSPLASSAAGSSAGSVEQKQTLTKDMTAENIKIELMKIHDALSMIVGPLPSLQRETKISMLATLVALIAAANQTNSYSSVGYTRIVSQWPGGGGEPDFQAMRRDPQLHGKLAHCLRSGKSFNVKANYITELLEKEPSADELDAFVATASSDAIRARLKKIRGLVLLSRPRTHSPPLAPRAPCPCDLYYPMPLHMLPLMPSVRPLAHCSPLTAHPSPTSPSTSRSTVVVVVTGWRQVY